MKKIKTILFFFVVILLSGYYSQAQVVSKADSGFILLKGGTSLDDYNNLLNTDKYVLVDFYADWCIPCKQLTPVIDSLKKEKGDKLIVIRINQDNNKALMDKLVVDELPTILIYRNQKIKWTGIGFQDKHFFEEQLQ